MHTTVDTEKENKEILRQYRKLLRSAKPYLKGNDAKIIKKAFITSAEAHADMRRKSGEPYIFHPIAVAQIAVEEIGLGTTSVVSALLHDVVEDTSLTLKDIEKDFGPKVAKIIDGLTKIAGVFTHGSSQQAENFRKMLLTLADDVRVILIKLADRLHNMRTLDSMPREKQLKIASETLYLYAPLAHRLGLYTIKTELEDLYLKFSEPELYKEISKKLERTKSARSRFINKFTAPVKTALEQQGLQFEVKGRLKSVYSVRRKMQKQNIPFEEVYDLFAVRIIIDTTQETEKAACWQVYSVVTDFYEPNPDRLRDWISTPRANGYESLHTTVMSNPGQWVEVQIRTQRMDDIAEKGYAAHWKYKESKTSAGKEQRLEKWLNMVRDTLQQNNTNALEFVDDFRANLFREEIFVFTPQGDLRVLPQGATALDFAFDIHTQIGAQCVGAKVNQKLVPLSSELANGDQIEILTSVKQKPNEGWLQFAVTTKAKSKIKDFLKEHKKEIATEGKEIVRRKFKQLKLELNQETTNELIAYFETKTSLELFYRFAKGTIDPKEIKRFKERKVEDKKKSRIRNVVSSITKKFKEQKPPDKDLLLIGEDMDKIDYTLSKCCNPIPGDEVFGFVTVKDGIKIHRTNCKNSVGLMSNYGYRVVKAKWTSQQELAFLAGIRIIGTDRVGIINDISTLISGDLKVNMRSITVDTKDGIFEGEIMVYVNDTQHLEELIKKLKKIDRINTVVRFD